LNSFPDVAKQLKRQVLLKFTQLNNFPGMIVFVLSNLSCTEWLCTFLRVSSLLQDGLLGMLGLERLLLLRMKGSNVLFYSFLLNKIFVYFWMCCNPANRRKIGSKCFWVRLFEPDQSHRVLCHYHKNIVSMVK